MAHLPCHARRPSLCHLKQSPKRDRQETQRATAVTTDLSTKAGTTLFCGLLAEAPMPFSAYLPPAGQQQNTPISPRGPPLLEPQNAVHPLFLPNASKRSNWPLSVTSHGAVLHLGNAFGHGIKGINEDVYCPLRNVRSLQNRGEMLQVGNPLTVKLVQLIHLQPPLR
jgi:hypothetical protein